MSIAYFKEKKIRLFCTKLELQPVHASPAMLNVVQECFTYTLRFKISCWYNLISNLLVKGPDVVSCKGKQEAVDLDVIVSAGQIALTLRPFAIRNPPPSLDHFNICYQALQNFQQDPESTIEEFSIYDSWCHVMPSMKRGQLVRISRQIPNPDKTDGLPATFTDYAGLKKYWKNHHGLRLPESDENILYGSIYFKLIGLQKFTYPLCCLRTKGLQILPRCDEPAVIKDFMGCLHQRMDQICGFKLVYSSKPCYSVANLSLATQIKNGKLENVKTAEIDTKKAPPPPTRPAKTCGHVSFSSQNSMKDIIPPSQKPCGAENNPKNIGPSPQASDETKKKNSSDIASVALKAFPTTADGRYIPVFAKNKQNIMINNSRNCAKKINLEIIKKKRPRKANLGMVASKAADKKYKTPLQVSSSLNDSGYRSSETPAPPKTGVKAARKYNPKKLCFDSILDSSLQNELQFPWKSTSKQPMSSLNIVQKHAFSSPLSKTKQIFPDKRPKVSTAMGGNESPLKIIKNHSFDKLFSSASSTHPDKVTHVPTPWSLPAQKDSGISFLADSRVKPPEDHSFDTLFKTAKGDRSKGFKQAFANRLSFVAQQSRNEVGDYLPVEKMEEGVRRHCGKTSDGNDSFDKLFLSASSLKVQTNSLMKSQLLGDSGRALPDSFIQLVKAKSSYEHISEERSNGLVMSKTVSLDHGQKALVSGNVTPEISKLTKKSGAPSAFSTATKKSRTVLNVSVEELARTDTLKKANAPTLAAWLRSKGVSVMSRDKKDDLVGKVKFQIMMNGFSENDD